MAPAMSTLMAAGEIRSALAKWSNIPDGIAKWWDNYRAAREPPEFCDKSNDWIAFPRFATRSKTHRKNEEAHLEDTEMTIKCPYNECMQRIRISKYAKHIDEHITADEAHFRAVKIQQAKGTATLKKTSKKTRTGLSRGWCKIDYPRKKE